MSPTSSAPKFISVLKQSTSAMASTMHGMLAYRARFSRLVGFSNGIATPSATSALRLKTTNSAALPNAMIVLVITKSMAADAAIGAKVLNT